VRGKGLLLSGVVALVGVACATTAWGSPENLHSSSPDVTLDLSPQDGTNLSSADQLMVTGGNFGTAKSGDLFQCTNTPMGEGINCGDQIGRFTSNTSGMFIQYVTVTRTFTPVDIPGPAIDCATTACMVWAQTDGGTPSAGHAIAFSVSSGTGGPIVTAPLGPTGQRAAALKKCKKKHSHRQRKKCKKKAKLLPV
jgi:neocarzinostatin family protein